MSEQHQFKVVWFDLCCVALRAHFTFFFFFALYLPACFIHCLGRISSIMTVIRATEFLFRTYPSHSGLVCGVIISHALSLPSEFFLLYSDA